MDQPDSNQFLRNYEQRLSRVTRYIYAHLDQPLDLNKLAEIACMSPYHWHRIYQAMQGESVIACVKRLRLHRAADYLSNSSKKLKTIAALSGYPNLQSFNRTFSARYGIPPARFRKKYAQQFPAQSATLKQDLITDFSESPPDSQPESQPDLQTDDQTCLVSVVSNVIYTEFSSRFNPGLKAEVTPQTQRRSIMYPINIVNSPEIKVLAVEHQGSYMNIGVAFDLLTGCAASRQLLTESTRWFGVYLDDPGLVETEKLHSWACISAPEILPEISPENAISAPISEQTIKSGKFAILHYQGPYSNLSAVYQWLYSSWLPASGLEAADAPVFEEYLNNPRDTAPEQLLTDIYLALK